MGGEGSMMAANQSLKSNRSLLEKRKGRGALGGSYSNLELAEFPDAAPEQLLEIKERLEQENKQNRKKQVIFFLVLAVLMGLGFTLLIS